MATAPVVAVVAVVAAAAYSAAVEDKTAKTQAIAQEAAVSLNTAQAQTAAARQGAIHAKSFRQALAQQVAVASQRGGGGSIMRQFSSSSVHNFITDQQAIKAGIRLHGIQAQNQYAQIAADRSAVRMRGITSVLSAGTSAFALSGGGSGGESGGPDSSMSGGQWVNPNIT